MKANILIIRRISCRFHRRTRDALQFVRRCRRGFVTACSRASHHWGHYSCFPC